MNRRSRKRSAILVSGPLNLVFGFEAWPKDHLESEQMEPESVRHYFEQASVVDHYSRGANNVGLWRSEEALFNLYFNRDDSLLELGTGAGRIAIGLWEIGFRHLIGIDLSRAMIKEARRINQVLEYGIAFHQGDATGLVFDNDQFDGAIFGFNGLMQIPGRQRRQQAIREIFRVLVPGAFFIFTTHDRQSSRHRNYWKTEEKLWREGRQDPDLLEYGDVRWDTPEGGSMFIHSPLSEDVRSDLKAAGFSVERDVLRSAIGPEPENVREFSDDCRFWIARKPKPDQPKVRS